MTLNITDGAYCFTFWNAKNDKILHQIMNSFKKVEMDIT